MRKTRWDYATPSYVEITWPLNADSRPQIVTLTEAAHLLGYTPHGLRTMINRDGGTITRRTFTIRRLTKAGDAPPVADVEEGRS